MTCAEHAVNNQDCAACRTDVKTLAAVLQHDATLAARQMVQLLGRGPDYHVPGEEGTSVVQVSECTIGAPPHRGFYVDMLDATVPTHVAGDLVAALSNPVH